MNLLHQDTDILKYEPELFRQSVFENQALCKGATATLNGSAFTAAGANFSGCGVTAGGVIYIATGDGLLDGNYEIVSVVSATQLTVSVLRADPAASPIPVGNASYALWKIKTFAPQAAEAAVDISRLLGLKPGCPESLYGLEDMANASGLRQASVCLALSRIYGTLYGTGEADKTLWDMYSNKQQYYQKCMESAIGRNRIAL